MFIASKSQVTKETDWHSRNLKGKVKSLRETCYKAVKVAGEIHKGKRQHVNRDDASYITYNDEGRKIETDEYGKDGKVSERRTYVYDDNGIYTGVEVYDANGVLTSKHTYVNTYDDKGNLISREHLRPDGSLDNRYTYTYDNNGNMLEYTWFGGGKAAGSKEVCKYDGKGNMIEDILYKPDGKIDWKFNYTYDEKGNRTEESDYKGSKFIIRYFINYDEQGNETEVDWCHENGKPYRKYFQKYIYDNGGNWITLTAFQKNKPIYIFERELTYFSR
jgi:hypothetical protein